MLFFAQSLGWLGDHRKSVIAAAVFLVSGMPLLLSAKPVLPVLTTDTTLATAGYYQLSWRPGIDGASDKILQYELQQATNPEFSDRRSLYRGPDLASVISGKPDGRYYYRVRIINPNNLNRSWSHPVMVEVRHHSLLKAFGFFTIGALVFFLTLFFVISRSRSLDET